MLIPHSVLYSTIQPQELLWAGFSLTGLTYQLRGLYDAVQDHRSLVRDGRNGARRIVARDKRRTQINACAMHILFLMVGVVAMTQAPADPHQTVTVTSIVLTFVLFGANGILVINAILGRRARVKLEAYLDREAAAAHPSDEGKDT